MSAKARKTPAGTWRCQASRTVDGVQTRRSFTADTKAEAEYLAMQWKLGFAEEEKKKKDARTFGELLDEFLDNRTNVLSPSSMRGYRQMQRNAYHGIEDVPAVKIDTETVQKWVNGNAKHYAPKTLRSQLGLLSQVLGRSFKVKLPAKEKTEELVPTEEEVVLILRALEGTEMECQVLCALMLGMRQSEIAALRWDGLHDGLIEIHGAIVADQYNRWVFKTTNKSDSSRRTLPVPSYLWDRLTALEKDEDGFIFHRSPDYVEKNWRRLTRRLGLPPFKMHGLRHYNASVMLLQGIPDKYAMERLGQSTPGVLKYVYQETYDSEHRVAAERMDGYFNSLADKK